QADVVERAEALQRLEAQEVREATDRFGQERFHVPGVSEEGVIRAERLDRAAETVLNRADGPLTFGELQTLARKWQLTLDPADAPRREAREEVADVIASLGEELGQLESVDVAAASRWPVEQEADDCHLGDAFGLWRFA